MTSSVPVRCPACRREHAYVPPAFPCACGAPVVPPLDADGTVTPLTQRTWAGDWVTVRCGACGRHDDWPQPEFGCACGTVLRVPVVSALPAADGPERRLPEPARPAGTAAPRPAFRPVTIRTAADAAATVALYLRWLGRSEIRRPRTSADSVSVLDAEGLTARVDPTTRPVSVRDVECLWLAGLAASALGVSFALAGYGEDARARADELGVPLFALDLTGTPQPVNAAAEELVAAGGPNPVENDDAFGA
ncbi:hypothetical protein [Streptomyces sp. NPDC060194]|uniref:hypothetical protein n=1 Tax=Streptomyces sp. NPDC060194 TaxID=3347069 RepID=UPI00365B8056